MLLKSASVHLVLAAALLGLAGCAAEVKIGDTNHPLMPPGQGLIATTVVFSNPTQPEFMKPNRMLFHFIYEGTGGTNGSFSVSESSNPSWRSKKVRAIADDGDPVLILTPAKPGKYRMERATVIEAGQFIILTDRAPEIEVVAGQVTYAGSFRFTYTTRFIGPNRVPRNFSMDVTDAYDMDVAELRALDPRLQSVVVKNAAPK